MTDKLWNVRRDAGLCVRFPVTGEPRNKYYEENRANQIAYIERNYRDGWLPDCQDGWWIFRKKTSSEPVPPFNDIYVLVQGKYKRLVPE